MGFAMTGGLSRLDRAHPPLRNAVYLVGAYAAVTLLGPFFFGHFPCATCDPVMSALRDVYFYVKIAGAVAILIALYFGMRGNVVAFMTVFVLLFFNALLSPVIYDWYHALIPAFIAYWGYVGVSECLKVQRAGTMLEELKHLPPDEIPGPPPPPWIPPNRFSTRPPR